MLRHLIVHDGIHDSGCTLKIYRSECFRDWHLRSDWHRFIPALLKARGFRIGEIEVHHRPRTAGHSKYGLARGINGLRDMLMIRSLIRKGRIG